MLGGFGEAFAIMLAWFGMGHGSHEVLKHSAEEMAFDGMKKVGATLQKATGVDTSTYWTFEGEVMGVLTYSFDDGFFSIWQNSVGYANCTGIMDADLPAVNRGLVGHCSIHEKQVNMSKIGATMLYNKCANNWPNRPTFADNTQYHCSIVQQSGPK